MNTRIRLKLIVCLAVFAVQGVFAQEEEEAPVVETEAAEVAPVAEVEMPAVVETAPIPESIPANVAVESSSSGGFIKPAVSIGLLAAGLGTVIYGIVENSNVVHYVKKRDGKAAVDAESRRNLSYGIGAALLAGGVVVYLAF